MKIEGQPIYVLIALLNNLGHQNYHLEYRSFRYKAHISQEIDQE